MILSYLIEVRGLKQGVTADERNTIKSYLIEVRGLKQDDFVRNIRTYGVVSYRGTWVETQVVNE